MGIDACIYFESKVDTPAFEWSMPPGFTAKNGVVYGPPSATHTISQSCRYYSPDYERGNWPQICAALMILFACPDVTKVWYYGDETDRDGIDPISIQDVLDLSRHYMQSSDKQT